MCDKPDGGPAFPLQKVVTAENGERRIYLGMTLRDWFAGQALVGMRVPWPGDHGLHRNFADHAADTAYQVADALIAERSK